MDLSNSEKQLIWDYIFFHYQSTLNTNPEDYRAFNYLMFRAIKMNFAYTVGLGMGMYYFLIGKKGIFKGYTSPGYIALGITIYSSIQFYTRVQNLVYSEEALKYAMKYNQDVKKYNDHYRRLYGNA